MGDRTVILVGQLTTTQQAFSSCAFIAALDNRVDVENASRALRLPSAAVH
jgi:hypothetical protein